MDGLVKRRPTICFGTLEAFSTTTMQFSLLLTIAQAVILTDISIDPTLNRALATPLVVFNETYVSKQQRVFILYDKAVPEGQYYTIYDAFSKVPEFLISSAHRRNRPLPYRRMADLYGNVICNMNAYSDRRMICQGKSLTNCSAFLSLEAFPWLRTDIDIDVYNKKTGRWFSARVDQYFGKKEVEIHLRYDRQYSELIGRLRHIKVQDEQDVIKRLGREHNYAVHVAPGADAAFVLMVAARFANYRVY